jgi:hypothetical protein
MSHAALRAADPAANAAPDPRSPAALQLLSRITSEPQTLRPRRRPVRLALVSGGVVAAALAAGLAVEHGSGHQSGIGPAGFVVTKHADGSVTATMRWAALSDPAALQRALDAAGARTKVFVETDAGSPVCAPHAHSVPYSADAVAWNGPDSADPDGGLVVHPDEFPHGGTFVVVVMIAPAGQQGMSTLAPSFPQITSSLTFMAVGPVDAPRC